MEIYCEEPGCTKSFSTKIKSGQEDMIKVHAKAAGFTSFNYLGEYIYNLHHYCSEHKYIGIAKRAASKITFEVEEAEEAKRLQEEKEKSSSNTTESLS